MVEAPPDFADASDLESYRAGDPDTLIAQAQGAIRRYCGWHIAPEMDETFVLDGNGGYSLWLPTLFVSAVESITDEGTAVDSSDYDWSATGYIQRRSGCWSTRPRQVEITVTHGYPEIPAELVGVAVAWANRVSSSPAYKRETTGPFSVEAFEPGFLLHEQAILDKFKLPPRP